MISIDLTSSIKRQISYCLCYENYRCGIFISQKEKFKSFSEAFAEFISFYDNLAILTRTSEKIEVRFPVTGSFIRVVVARESVRGYRVNGMIIDNDIKPELTQTVLLPYIIKRYSSEVGGLENDDKPLKRVFCVDIKDIDILRLKIEKFNYKEIRNMGTANLFNGAYSLCSSATWAIGNTIGDITHPDYQQETNGKKIMIYKACGVPKEKIEYTTEFINKTKEMYLIIKGEHEIFEDWSSKVNLRIFIDTKIYDGYSVDIKDGLITVTLYEIKNEAPELKNYSEDK